MKYISKTFEPKNIEKVFKYQLIFIKCTWFWNQFNNLFIYSLQKKELLNISLHNTILLKKSF